MPRLRAATGLWSGAIASFFACDAHYPPPRVGAADDDVAVKDGSADESSAPPDAWPPSGSGSGGGAETGVPDVGLAVDLGAEFSFAQNPNGVWRYGYTTGATLSVDQVALDTFESRLRGRPHRVLASREPGHERLHVTRTSPRTRARPPPANMYRGLSGRVLAGDAGLFRANIEGYGGDPAFHVVEGTSPSADSQGVVALQVKDTLTFAIGYGTDLTNYNDTTGLAAHITLIGP